MRKAVDSVDQIKKTTIGFFNSLDKLKICNKCDLREQAQHGIAYINERVLEGKNIMNICHTELKKVNDACDIPDFGFMMRLVNDLARIELLMAKVQHFLRALEKELTKLLRLTCCVPIVKDFKIAMKLKSAIMDTILCPLWGVVEGL